MASIGLMLLVILVPIALLVTGAVLLILGRRNRLDHPACGSCGYDVTATVGTMDRCPECGALFVEAGVLPPGRPPKRRAMLTVGIVCLILGGSCGVLTVAPLLLAATRGSAAAARARAAAAQQQQAEAEAAAADADAARAPDDEATADDPG